MKRGGKALAIGGGVVGMGALLVVALSGGEAKASPGPDPEPKPPEPKPPEPKPPEPKPPEPKPPGPAPKPGEPLEFDLSTNWGGVPKIVREELARIELASGIPGLARALAVKAWQAYRAGQAKVSRDEAAKIAAANPDLARTFLNKGDAQASRALLERGVKPKDEGGNGWPRPKDYDGWAAGSYGLFDILGGTAAFAGIHQGFTPLIEVPSAAAAMATWPVQGFVAGYVVWRFLYSDLYDVLVPGPAATQGDSAASWANIFSAWATPFGYVQKSPEALAARQRYMDRADEIGIDLSQVAYPWPPGVSYKPSVWVAKAVWERLQDYRGRPVGDLGGGQDKPNPGPVQPAPGQLAAAIELPGGIRAYQRQPAAPILGPAPLIVVLHGRGGDQTAMLDLVPEIPGARVFFLRGGLEGDGGRVFFTPRLADPDAKVAPAMAKAGGDLIAGLVKLQSLYPTTKVGVIGFSQGGGLALYLATTGAADWVYSHAGALPDSLRARYPQAVRVVEWHGAKDQTVPAALDAATADAFLAAGYPNPLWVLDPDAGHRAPRAEEVSKALEDGLPTVDLKSWEDTGILIEEGTCAMLVEDAGRATLAFSQALLPTARELAPVDGRELRDLVDAFLGDLAPYCLLGSKPWKDSLSAMRGYWAVRGALRGLVTRGLLPAAEAESLLTDLRAGAIGAGVQDKPELLPRLGLGPAPQPLVAEPRPAHRLTLVVEGPVPPIASKAAAGVADELAGMAARAGWTVRVVKTEPLVGKAHRITLIVEGPQPRVSTKHAQGIADELRDLASRAGWFVRTAQVEPIPPVGFGGK